MSNLEWTVILENRGTEVTNVVGTSIRGVQL